MCAIYASPGELHVAGFDRCQVWRSWLPLLQCHIVWCVTTLGRQAGDGEPRGGSPPCFQTGKSYRSKHGVNSLHTKGQVRHLLPKSPAPTSAQEGNLEGKNHWGLGDYLRTSLLSPSCLGCHKEVHAGRRKRGRAAWLMLCSLKGVKMLSRGLAKVGLQWTGLTKAVKDKITWILIKLFQNIWHNEFMSPDLLGCSPTG